MFQARLQERGSLCWKPRSLFSCSPWFANIGKRLTRSPKLYFCDVGLASWLLGIREESHLDVHPLKGQLFENLVVLEIMKQYLNQGKHPQLHFYRDSSGLKPICCSRNRTALSSRKSNPVGLFPERHSHCCIKPVKSSENG